MEIIKEYEEDGKRHTIKKDGNFTVHVVANEPSSEAIENFNKKFNRMAEEIPLHELEKR